MNLIRKNTSEPDIANKARSLVKKWKKLVIGAKVQILTYPPKFFVFDQTYVRDNSAVSSIEQDCIGVSTQTLHLICQTYCDVKHP